MTRQANLSAVQRFSVVAGMVACLGAFTPAHGHDGPKGGEIRVELTVERKTDIYLREKRAERRANLEKWRRVVTPAREHDRGGRTRRAWQIRNKRLKEKK